MLKPVIVSMGDPAGIGPEIIARAWAKRHELGLPDFVVAGDRSAFDCFAEKPALIGDFAKAEYTFGQSSHASAQAGWDALQQAATMTVQGLYSAIVTAPVAKSALYALGFKWPGQTEFVSEAAGVNAAYAVMMLAGPSLRTVPLTIHMPLSHVASSLTSLMIIDRARTVAKALQQDFGIARPRLVLAGLNPHAGEAGTIGREELDVFLPAVTMLQAEGIDIRGPLSADTLFHQAARKSYDVALCAYHDQALIPIKTLHFDDGVNVTLGLPIVRTSPDHGTAFDIAGKNIAKPDAMIAAIRMAGEIALRRHRQHG